MTAPRPRVDVEALGATSRLEVELVWSVARAHEIATGKRVDRVGREAVEAAYDALRRDPLCRERRRGVHPRHRSQTTSLLIRGAAFAREAWNARRALRGGDKTARLPKESEQAFARFGITVRSDGYTSRPGYKKGGQRDVFYVDADALDVARLDKAAWSDVEHFSEVLARAWPEGAPFGRPHGERADEVRLPSRLRIYQRRLDRLKTSRPAYARAVLRALTTILEAKSSGQRDAIVTATELREDDALREELEGWRLMVRRGEARLVRSRTGAFEPFFQINRRVWDVYATLTGPAAMVRAWLISRFLAPAPAPGA